MTPHDFVRQITDEETWPLALEEYGPVGMAVALKSVLKRLGQQEQERGSGLSIARTDEAVSDAEYETMKRGLLAWRRSVARVRQTLNKRLAEVVPVSQQIRDDHQADRRVLVILAKRIWLWEQGAEMDGLDDVLDQFDISNGDGQPRISLRYLLDEIATYGEVTA